MAYAAKTTPTDRSVAAFLNAVEHPTRRADALALDALFRKTTGWTPQMWGPSIVGYGSYAYVYKSGNSGTCHATGFSPRKANLSIYIMPGYAEFGDILGRLGKHKMGKSCLYINTLADVDVDILAELVQAGLKRLAGIYPIQPS